MIRTEQNCSSNAANKDVTVETLGHARSVEPLYSVEYRDVILKSGGRNFLNKETQARRERNVGSTML